MNIRIIGFLIVVALGMSPVAARALARAPFPDGKKLQPIPSPVQPNVSGNVNASLAPAYDHTDSPEEQQGDLAAPSENSPENAISGPRADDQLHPSAFPWTTAGVVAGIIAGVVAILFFARKRSE